MSGSDSDENRGERIRESAPENRPASREEPKETLGQRPRAREPQSSEDEESEDNDGGPPSSRRH
jgi:hypothetical protein